MMTNIHQQLKAPGAAGSNHDAGDLLVRAFTQLRDELISKLLVVWGKREDAQDAAEEAFIKCWAARGIGAVYTFFCC